MCCFPTVAGTLYSNGAPQKNLSKNWPIVRTAQLLLHVGANSTHSKESTAGRATTKPINGVGPSVTNRRPYVAGKHRIQARIAARVEAGHLRRLPRRKQSPHPTREVYYILCYHCAFCTTRPGWPWLSAVPVCGAFQLVLQELHLFHEPELLRRSLRAAAIPVGNLEQQEGVWISSGGGATAC